MRGAQTREEVAHRQGGEPIKAIVSIKSQHVAFYDADGWILRAPVSTGAAELETPAGVFAIVQKKKDHHSNVYDDAWMPHMQRITWNGIALHGGSLPGYAASHGCVRLPFGFAEDLRQDADRNAGDHRSERRKTGRFSHPTLLVPNAEALAVAAARAGPLVREAAEAARADDEAKRAAMIAAREAATLTASLRELELPKRRADAELESAEKALIGAQTHQTKVQAEDLKRQAARKAAELGKQLDAVSAEAQQRLDASNSAKDAAKAAEIKKDQTSKAAEEANLALEPVSIYISRATQKLYMRRATHKPVPDRGEVFDASIEFPVKISNPGKPIGAHVFTAMAREGAGLRWSAVTIDDSDDAGGALDRITIPPEVIDRVAANALPRSSIIVSGESLSSETNYRTEFVAVLSNHP